MALEEGGNRVAEGGSDTNKPIHPILGGDAQTGEVTVCGDVHCLLAGLHQAERERGEEEELREAVMGLELLVIL
jgi:hypothetical protein